MEFIYDAVFGLTFIGLENKLIDKDFLVFYHKCLDIDLTEDLMKNESKILSNY